MTMNTKNRSMSTSLQFFMSEEPDADKIQGVTPVSEGLWALEFPDEYYNEPIYDEAGLAHFTSYMVDGGPCNGRYFFEYSIGQFSKDGYAPASMVTNDGKTTYKGIIDKKVISN